MAEEKSVRPTASSEISEPKSEDSPEKTRSSLLWLQDVSDGLKIKLGQQIIAPLTYGHAGDSKPVDWKVLAAEDEEIEGEHIRCLPLKEGEDLGQLVEQFQSAHAKAIVFVNSREDFMVEPQQWPQGSSIPVLLLKASDGKKLLSTVDTNSEVFGQVQVESHVDAGPTPIVAVTQEPTAVQAVQPARQVPERRDKEGTMEKIMARFTLGDKHNLNAEIKQLMFSNDTPVIVSEDIGTFTMVMSTFQQYEKTAKGDGSHGDVLKKIVKCLNNSDVFEKDFPFYIILAYRIKQNRIYKCDDSPQFFSTIIDKMETLDPLKLCSTLNAFFQRRDFPVMFGQQDSNSNVFTLLETACLELSVMATKRHKSETESGSPEDLVYKRMVWVSVALKCHSEAGAVTTSVADIWNRQLLQMRRELVFTAETTDALKRGLNLTRFLNIPPACMMGSEQLIRLANVEDSVRPLSHLMNYLDCISGFITTKDDVAHLVTTLRASYQSWISENHPSVLKSLSKEGTVAGAIQEGIIFVDKLSDILKQKELKEELRNSEGLCWLLLLLQLVDVTKSGAEEHLMKFFAKGKIMSEALKTHRVQLTKDVIERTRQSFPQLPIHLFFPLYKNLRIWPHKFVEEYLNVYKIPLGIKICDGTWNVFINEVIDRHSGGHNHRFLLEFIKRVGTHYATDRRPLDFILDLLDIKVPKLFALPEKTDNGYAVAVEVQGNLSTIVQDYIYLNALKSGLLQRMSKILCSISEQLDDFQQLILTVLQKEVIPEVRVLQSGEHSAQEVLSTASTKLQKDLSWIQALNPQQTFCWGIVAACCQKTSTSITTDSFDWVHSCDYIVSQLGQIYVSYCNGKKLPESERILSDPLPQDIVSLHSDDVCKFFEWVRKLQTVLLDWQKNFVENNCNYDDILLYANNQSKLFQIGQLVCSKSIIVGPQDTQLKMNYYLQLFEKVNAHFIKYILGNPDAKYSTLPHILHRYGVVFPSKFTKHILLPGEKASPTGERPLLNPLSPCTTGLFQPPGQNISLQATKGLTMTELAVLTEQLDQFVKPLLDHMDMLVFFSLHQCEIFNNYLHLQLKEECSAKQFVSVNPSMRPSISFSTLRALPKQEGSKEEGVSLQILARALNTTRNFLAKLIQGTAKYSEIIAEGGMLTLESINIEAEFNTLATFFATVELAPQVSSDEGLKAICSMLELFQYTSFHIPAIYGVCQQYNLEGCLNDPSLKEVVRLAEEVERSRANLTPLEAVGKMQCVKNSLYHKKPGSYSSLGLFPAVANSAAFFQFVRDKRFDGEKGQAAFGQQYQLITAQLQHEEYNENVLNHLYAAYKFILPFMDSKQNFNSLMTKVTSLDVSGGLKQLETVNSNITLIRLWFSRAEGDTLQNVAKDLDSIIQTGHYQFEFSSTEAIVISLHYCHADSAQATPLGQPSSLEEGLPQRPQAGKKEGKEGTGKERWSKEQIDDFVRKLGFLDAEKEGGDKIKHFLHLNETANAMLKLYTQLRDLGCADFTKGAKHITLPCITEDPDSLVHVIEAKLSSWKDELSKLCDENRWMLFFTTPKLLLLHKDLSDWMSLAYMCDSKSLPDMKEKMETMSHIIGNETKLHDLKQELSMVQDVSLNDWTQYSHRVWVECKELMNRAVRHIVREVSFLCTNDVETFGSMKIKVETLLSQRQHEFIKCQTPMLTISMFLSALLLNHLLPTRLKPVQRPMTSVAGRMSISPECSQVLHSCPGFTQNELIPMILSIFGGVPEPFQIFRCQSSSTQEELDLFLQRAAEFPITHLILEVNKLPFQLQEHLMKFHLEIEHTQSVQSHVRLCLQYIETKPSSLRDIPWITVKEHKMEPGGMRKVQRDKLAQSLVQLVFGNAGDGKTHYIKRQLEQCPSSCTISVNEAFAPLGAIKKLRRLPSDKPDCAIFFNFTLLPPEGRSFPLHNLNNNPESEDKQTAEHTLYRRLIEVIGWFFFDLLILGYVEDRDTGLSFRLPGGLDWVIYVEVPSRDLTMTPEEMLEQFCGDIPTLGLLGSARKVLNEIPFIIDEEVQLVCKYLKAYKEKRIDRLYKDGRLVQFSLDSNIAEEECHKLLDEFMPRHIRTRKITQRLFIKYMNTRCFFLDHLPAFNYNLGVGEYTKNSQGEQVPTNTRTLGSTLMEAMLKEVSDFCDPAIKENWSINPHQQLIYDTSSIDLITLHADKLLAADRTKFMKIGVKVPSMMEMHTRDILDKYLSKALGVELKDGCLKQIDEANYVLTLDYTLKMLNIHERYRCGVPVIIEGETGVGKTALVQMLSALWNHSLLGSWNTEKGRIHDLLTRRIGDLSEDSCESYGKCVQLINQLSEDKHVSCEDMQLLCSLPGSSQSSEMLCIRLRQHLLAMRHLPVVRLLVTKEKTDLGTLFAEADANNTVEATAKLLQAVYYAQLKSTFYKLNIHAALTPLEIQELLKPAFDQARELQLQLESKQKFERIPFVTVFLDEVNTSSCLGLLKEFIVDRTMDGEPIPKNMFVVAACNPHRGNSLASHEQDRWLRGSYYVRPLHPTLQLIMWDYGSLDTVQESDYINAKMKMLHRTVSNVEIAGLTELIVESQEVMRHYAEQLLRSHGVSPDEAKIASHSCVSQRDIQRVFTLHEWLMKGYTTCKPYGDRTDYHRRAVLVALGIVYYMRLNTKFREAYKDLMDKGNRLPNEVRFSQAFNDELNWYIDQVELPQGIAKTQALKENIFATIICTVTRIPLIIVGAPGSSKTLSFNITVANLKGQESKMQLFRHTDKYPSLDPHYYQCSRRTTSNEIQTVFSRAINRQKSHLKISLPINCVVFMDEAGLPEESHESLKVLHYYLDNPEVSFVAITNHVLDAAKTNRAISLFRPESSADDLETLAKGCLCSDPDNPPPELKNDLTTIAKLCSPYLSLMEQKEFKQFFGLRDFIHFVNYLRRKCQNTLNAQVVLEALERNFNGSDEFEHICKQFLLTLGARLEHVAQRQILDILRDSLADRPNEANRTENEVRYKLIIDPSEDDSLVRLLFTFGVLDRQKTRVFVCSDFLGDTHLQKINTIAAIRHSAIEGHTVVMAQTDDIHESFYDLFNQRFRRIDDAHGPRYYANIAIGAHSKPCRVHPEFQCVVVVKQSEVKNTPAPFLNRFEKYRLTHHALLDAALGILPPCMAVIIRTVREKVNEFVGSVRGKESFYGLKEETTDSLLLSMLPTERHTYQPYELKDDLMSDNAIEVVCLQELIRAFRTSAGFHIPTCSLEELTLDAQHVSYLVCSDTEFQGLLPNITPQGVVRGVADAMQKLHEAPSPQGGNVPNVGLSSEGCMMVALGVQWLVRHLCKRLMQLMTPEALTVHRMKMDSSYLVNYLKHHSHFSLKVLIRDRLAALNHTTVYCPTKLLCYTRTSPLVHKLPSSYSGSGFYARGLELAHEAIRDLVLDDLAAVVVHKLSNKPQNSIREQLKTFVVSESAQVLLLIANMAEVTVPMVNHLRIMIEEAENQNQCSQLPKLFVLLLHFPPHNFLNPCYSTLYLRGWDHYYLDTIGHHIGNGVIDVEDWFSHCCFPHDADANANVEDDTLVQTAKGLLEEAIPVISSRVPFSSHGGFPFNGQLTISQRDRLLRELLITKGVGGVLCQHFRSYWQPSVMSGYLEQAASLAHQQQSTLNITDTIQAAFKATFIDFVVVMVSRINENCNIDSVFVNGGSAVVDALFRDLFALSPLPPLAQLKVLSNNLQPPCNPGYVPVFPFFHLVIGHMDQLVEQSRRDANEGADVLGNNTMTPISGPHDMQTEFTTLQERMLCRIKEREESLSKECVVTFVQAVVRNPELWTSYFNNFIFSKLRLTSSESVIEKQIVQEVFGNLSTLDITERVVYLHAYIAVYQLNLAKVATILRSLAQIEKIKPVSSNILSPPPPSPTKQFMYSIRQTGNALSIQQLSTFVISALFNALLGCMYGGLPQAGALEQLKQWYRAYLDITTLPSLADSISAGLDGSAEMELARAQFNVMQTTFFVLQCKPDCDGEVLNMGQKVFCTLFTRHFKENGELKSKCLQLADVYHVAVECVKASEDDIKVHRLTERIFNHFFPANSTNCSSDDCRWFLAYANCQLTMGTETNSGEQVDLELQNGYHTNHQMSIHLFKLYLSRILGEQSGGGTTSSHASLAFYNEKRRSLLGVVLMSTPDLGDPTHYIPTFYQQSTFITLQRDAISARMQQPLAHLYFLTLMEHLIGKPQGLPALLRIYFTIFELCRSTTKTNEEKILLYIELQAVVQAIVQQVAIDLDPSEPSKMRQLGGIKKEVNSILDDPATGGGACKGHTLVLALHLFKRLKSFRKFTELLTVKFEAVCQGINCLEQFSVELKEQAEPKPHLFPLMAEGHPLGNLYQRVNKAMLKIHDGKGNIDELIKIASECFTTQKASAAANPGGDPRGAFKMAVWLTVYYDFFDKKKKSELLCNAIGGEKLSRFFEEGHIAIIQRFLNPELMLTIPELPNPLREDEEVLMLQPGGRQARPRQKRGKPEDPLLELFRPSKAQPPDQSDVDLRHALANMIAVVIASPKASNHLWYHMFAPGDLVDTYMTGFMYDTKVNPNGLHYDCGVELSPDGQFGRQDYLKHAGRGTYTLHSLYLLLWANFGAFCVALLTQPNADKKLHGTIISDWLSIRHYCVSQLRTIWLYIRNNLNISDEERSFFLMRCMNRFYELSTNPTTAGNMQGKLVTREQLDSYERLWHAQIYQPSWCELKEAFSQYSREWQNPVFFSIRHLDEQYPHFPTEKDFIHNLLSSGDISLQKQGGELYMLTQFVLERPQLQAGGCLLPDLVEFYLWLHTQLAYIVSYDKATELKIGQVVERAVERYSKDFGTHIKELYERVKVGYNAYVETIGHAIGAGACVAVRRGNKLYTIADNMPLLHFLSDTPEEEEGNDWLYIVMADIVNTHNNFIQGLYTMTRSQCLSVYHLLPSDPPRTPLTEFTLSHCIVGRKSCLHEIDDFLQLVRSRYTPQRTAYVPEGALPKALKNPMASVSGSVVQQHTPCQFDLHLLQEDVVATYLAGKPPVESTAAIRTHFKFRNMAQQSSPHPIDVASSGGDIDTLRDQLPDLFKVQCDDSTTKKMEFEFHSAGYLTLLEAVQGIKNVLGHLINFIKGSDQLDSVKTQTIREFMSILDSQIQNQNAPVFARSSTPTLSPPQLKFLENLPTVMVFSCLQKFIQWLKDGMYDFHTLPFTLKTHLPLEDQEALLQITEKWKGDKGKLLDELKALTSSLVHSEAYFTKNTNETLQVPMKKVLEDFHFISQDDDLPKFIPSTICVQHYVAFRVVLRSLVATVQNHVADVGKVEVEKWQEFVGDIWDKRLPHFRDFHGDGGMFLFNPRTGTYGFGDAPEDDQRQLLDVLDDDITAPDPPVGGNEDSTVNDSDEWEVVGSANDDESVSVDNLRKQMREDPLLREQLLSLARTVQKEQVALEELAKGYKVDDVLEFLHSIRMDQYIQTFRDEGIDGTLLVAFGEDELKDLGITSRFHCFKIQFLFKRTLQSTPTTHALVVVLDFLAANNMDKYRQRFCEEGIDGDMLFEILQLPPNESGNAILEEIGVSRIDKVKMRQRFKPTGQ